MIADVCLLDTSLCKLLVRSNCSHCECKGIEYQRPVSTCEKCVQLIGAQDSYPELTSC